MDTIQVNGQPYTVTRLLGKGKGGYSYLAQGSEGPVVVKQIHHEPCSYYQFGDKLQSELRDYRTLSALGIPMPRLLAVDEAQERLVKQYIPGPTVLEQLQTGTLPPQATGPIPLNCAPGCRSMGKTKGKLFAQILKIAPCKMAAFAL